jgi:hypothetical protein
VIYHFNYNKLDLNNESLKTYESYDNTRTGSIALAKLKWLREDKPPNGFLLESLALCNPNDHHTKKTNNVTVVAREIFYNSNYCTTKKLCNYVMHIH